MTTLKCTKCNKEFNNNGFINTPKVSGMSGVFIGKWKTYPIWPFQTSLVSVCPNCNEKSELLVIVSKKTKIVTILVMAIIIVFVGLAFIHSR